MNLPVESYTLWGGYFAVPDSNSCIGNYRERHYLARSILLDPTGVRIGEIESWTECCGIRLTSLRIDTTVASYSSSNGKYLCATIGNDYDPCKVTNDIGGTSFRHWRFRTIHLLKNPYSGYDSQDYSLKSGNGYVTTYDTIHAPKMRYRISYRSGIRDGFTFFSEKTVDTHEYELSAIVEFQNAHQTGLYVIPQVSGYFIVGYETSDRRIKEFYVNRKGRVLKHREFVKGGYEPVLHPVLDKELKGRRVCMNNPAEIVRVLFPGEDFNRYGQSFYDL